MESWLYSGLNVVRKGGQFYGFLPYSILCGRSEEQAGSLMVKNQLSLVLAGRGGGCVSVNCAVTFFLMLRQNYEVILISVLLSHGHRRLHLMVVLCET